MKILRNILVTMVVLVALLFAIGFMLPDSAHVEREAVIDANPETVFRYVNDLREFNRWSPWARLDPNTRYSFEGPASGVGAKMIWSSENPSVGSGSQEIIESVPYHLVRTRLDFGPEGQAIAFFELAPRDTGTHVVWGFDTEFGNNLIGRYMGLLFEGWVGSDYEEGLSNLKQLAEQDR